MSLYEEGERKKATEQRRKIKSVAFRAHEEQVHARHRKGRHRKGRHRKGKRKNPRKEKKFVALHGNHDIMTKDSILKRKLERKLERKLPKKASK